MNIDESKSTNNKVYLSVGIDFERSQVLLVYVNEDGGSSVVGVSAEQARCLSRLLESCAGQLESRIQRKIEEKKPMSKKANELRLTGSELVTTSGVALMLERNAVTGICR